MNSLVDVVLHEAELDLDLGVEVLGFVQHLMELVQGERAIAVDIGLFEELFGFPHHHFLLNGGAVTDGKHTLRSFDSKEFIRCYCTSTTEKEKYTCSSTSMRQLTYIVYLEGDSLFKGNEPNISK